jgi:teichuronic acid biosynthesis glycosyltransferase TuaG
MKQEKVDVVIPTYNQTNLLLEAVTSCMEQTCPVNKIIIVDDGSDEEVRNWITETFAENPRINLVFKDHTGLPSIGREEGVSHSQAEWIAFLDADDTWHPKKIELQLIFAANKKVDFVYTNASIFKDGEEDSSLFKHLPKRLNFFKLARTNWVINSSVMIRRRSLNQVGYATSNRVRGAEDYATWLRVVCYTEMRGIDENLTRYRILENSLSKSEKFDPGVYAYIDFLLWTKTRTDIWVSKLRFMRVLVLLRVIYQYGI